MTHVGNPIVYRRLQARLADFAVASPHRSFWTDLIARIHPDPVLPEDEWIVPDEGAVLPSQWLERLGDPGPLVRIVRSADNLIVARDTRPEEIDRFAAELPDDEQLALTVWIRRALQPIEALDTWPLDRFFDAEELQLLTRAASRRTKVQPATLAWRRDSDLTYSGYFCAIVKFTRLCNLRCVYCHDWRTGPGQTMTFGTLVRLYAEVLSASAYANVDIVWHGGEPTMLGPFQVLKILRLQNWFQRPGQRVKNNLQTNGTTINRRWARLLRRYGFSVSMSLDGPSEIHDRVRVKVRGTGTFSAVSRGLEVLRSEGIEPGVIVVLGHELIALGAERLYRFLQEHSIRRASVIPARPGNEPGSTRDDHVLAGTGWYTRFLVELADVRRTAGVPRVAIREIDTAMRALSGGMSGFCETLGNCAGAFCSFDPDGDVSHCDKFVGDPEYIVGNINREPLQDILAGSRMERIRQHAGAVDHLRQCQYFNLCRGWCPHERYVAVRTTAETSECCGLAPLYERLEEMT